MTDHIFVFGSNLGGIHGAGAAREAHKNFGAQYGIGVGAVGHSYAIPTKDGSVIQRFVGKTLPLYVIRHYVNQFKDFATVNPHLEFQVTRIGCGLADLKDEEIAPLFLGSPNNCSFDEAWKPWLGATSRYWGTF